MGQSLDNRIIEIAQEKERKRIAAEISALLEKERVEKELYESLMTKKLQFFDYLKISFKLWLHSLWRKESGVVFRSEIVSQFNEVAAFPEIRADANLLSKTELLICTISTPNSPLPEAHKHNTSFDVDEPLYHLDCATIQRWDSEFYVKIMTRLMIDWKLEDLNVFLKVFCSMILSSGTNRNNDFLQNLFIPKFPKVAVVRDWLQQFSLLSQNLVFDSPDKDIIKKAFHGFCTGREDSKFVFHPRDNAPDIVIENENLAIGFAETAYIRFCKCILAEYGFRSFVAFMKSIKNEAEIMIPAFTQSKIAELSADVTLLDSKDSDEVVELSAELSQDSSCIELEAKESLSRRSSSQEPTSSMEKTAVAATKIRTQTATPADQITDAISDVGDLITQGQIEDFISEVGDGIEDADGNQVTSVRL